MRGAPGLAAPLGRGARRAAGATAPPLRHVVRVVAPDAAVRTLVVFRLDLLDVGQRQRRCALLQRCRCVEKQFAV